jgi:pyruvate/2-oxoglutarate dehydrogenase complex dihydrolipoamide acyltransferase (E2) component
MNDRFERLNYADRWISDAFDVAILPAGFAILEVDMGRAMEMLANAGGQNQTPVALYLRAAAMALTRLPKLHRMIVGNRRYLYDRVDLCLSLAGKSAMAPRLIVRDAGNKTWTELASEVKTEAPKARASEAAELDRLRRIGWIVPFGFLRRMILRWMRTRRSFRDRKLGTFQVSVLPEVDVAVPLQFGTAGLLAAARVRDRVVVVNGSIVVRPTVMLTCSINHKVWDGLAAKRFLREVADILESGVLETEIHERRDETPAGATA